MKTLCGNKNTNRAWIIIDIVKDFFFFFKGSYPMHKALLMWDLGKVNLLAMQLK